MAKPIWVIDANYKRKDLARLIEFATEKPDAMKAAAEKRMAIYDAQPKLVRQCIGENGMGNGRHFIGLKTTLEKCEAIRNNVKLKYERTSYLLTT
jgi:hypothetical protein